MQLNQVSYAAGIKVGVKSLEIRSSDVLTFLDEGISTYISEVDFQKLLALPGTGLSCCHCWGMGRQVDQS